MSPMNTQTSSSTKPATESRPDHHARGCPDCTFGLINPPPANTYSLGLYQVRAIQAQQGELVFCSCAAGQTYRRYLGMVARESKDSFGRYVDETDTAPTMHMHYTAGG